MMRCDVWAKIVVNTFKMEILFDDDFMSCTRETPTERESLSFDVAA